MPVRDEILEVVRGAAYRALTNWKGENSAGEAQRLFGYFEGRRPVYTGSIDLRKTQSWAGTNILANLQHR